MYCITDWDANYEVDKDGRTWKLGKQFFAGPLPYTRAPSRRDWPVRLLQIRELVGDDVHTIVGVFERLCGIVACERREYREGGIVRNSKHEPASLREIAKMLLWPQEKTQWALETLCHPDVEWMSEVSQEPAELRESRESRENPRDSQLAATGQSQNISEQKNTESEDSSNSGKPHVLRFPGSDSDEKRGKGSDSDLRPEVRCFGILTNTLSLSEPKDLTALSNFVQWLHTNVSSGRAGPDAYNEAVKIARDCVNGDVPMAVFTARIKKHWRYEPPSKRQARVQ